MIDTFQDIKALFDKHSITKHIEDLGLKVINGNKLERSKASNLSKTESQLKRNLAIDYGEFGLHLPDVDMIIYEPKIAKVLAVISSINIREKILQLAYWKFKLMSDKVTEHIKMYAITTDNCHTFMTQKNRLILETDLDGSYVLTTVDIVESDKVKLFEHFIDDLKKLL